MVPGVFQSLFAFLFGYFCGAIPFGLVLTRVAGTSILRAIGSGNIGATNVLRTGRKDLAALTLLLDLLKGTIAVLTVAHFAPGAPDAFRRARGLSWAICFRSGLGFRAARGLRPFLGCLLAAAWPAGLAFGIVWLAVAFLTRYFLGRRPHRERARHRSVLAAHGPNRRCPRCSASWRSFCGPNIAPILRGSWRARNRGSGRADGRRPACVGSARPAR